MSTTTDMRDTSDFVYPIQYFASCVVSSFSLSAMTVISGSTQSRMLDKQLGGAASQEEENERENIGPRCSMRREWKDNKIKQ